MEWRTEQMNKKERYRRKFTQAWAAIVGNYVETGRLLIEAKADLQAQGEGGGIKMMQDAPGEGHICPLIKRQPAC